MKPGAHLSHAARTAADAQRMLLVAILHLEAADAVVPDLDELLNDIDMSDIDVAACLHDLGDLAAGLQRLVDAYGHREVSGRAAA